MIKKFKTHIQEKLFYTQLFFLLLTIILLTVYFLDSIIIGTNQYDQLAVGLQDTKLKLYLTGKIISYLLNSFILLVYLVYLVLMRHRIKIGYLFCFIWLLIFVAIAASPHLLVGSHDEQIRFATGIGVTIMSALTMLCILITARQIQKQRQIQKYEFYKIHAPQRGRRSGK